MGIVIQRAEFAEFNINLYRGTIHSKFRMSVAINTWGDRCKYGDKKLTINISFTTYLGT